MVPGLPETLELRNRSRLPLGLNIHDEDFSFEQNCVLYAAFDGEQVIGMGSMSGRGTPARWNTSVWTPRSRAGVWAVSCSKPWKALSGNRVPPISVWMPGSQPSSFYERAGYHTVGEIFLLSYAPVEHILMEKDL